MVIQRRRMSAFSIRVKELSFLMSFLTTINLILVSWLIDSSKNIMKRHQDLLKTEWGPISTPSSTFLGDLEYRFDTFDRPFDNHARFFEEDRDLFYNFDDLRSLSLIWIVFVAIS